MQKWCERLDQMRTGDGRPVPARLKIEIEREWKRLKVVAEQVREVKAERDRLLTGSEPTGDLCAEKMRRLVKLHGIGPKFACATLIATRTLAAKAGANQENQQQPQMVRLARRMGTSRAVDSSRRTASILRARPCR